MNKTKEPLNRRHTWDSMTDIERDIVINVSKCSMPSSEFLQALQEECGDSPSNTELHDETKFIPAMRIGPIKSVNSTDQGYRSSLTFGKKAKKPLHRSRSVTFNTESELESIFDGPHTITSRSSFIPKTQKKLKPIIK